MGGAGKSGECAGPACPVGFLPGISRLRPDSVVSPPRKWWRSEASALGCSIARMAARAVSAVRGGVRPRRRRIAAPGRGVRRRCRGSAAGLAAESPSPREQAGGGALRQAAARLRAKPRPDRRPGRLPRPRRRPHRLFDLDRRDARPPRRRIQGRCPAARPDRREPRCQAGRSGAAARQGQRPARRRRRPSGSRAPTPSRASATKMSTPASTSPGTGHSRAGSSTTSSSLPAPTRSAIAARARRGRCVKLTDAGATCASSPRPGPSLQRPPVATSESAASAGRSQSRYVLGNRQVELAVGDYDAHAAAGDRPGARLLDLPRRQRRRPGLRHRGRRGRQRLRDRAHRSRPTSRPRRAPSTRRYNGGSDAFVTKLNAAGSALVYSTYLGGRQRSIEGVGDRGRRGRQRLRDRG